MTAIDDLTGRHSEARRAFFSYFRGGLPSNSLPGGSRGSETPLPAFDRDDRIIQWRWKQYHSWLVIAMTTNSRSRQATAIHNALTHQNWFLLTPDPLEDIKCEDPHCVNLLELGRKSGKCAMHRMREIRKAKRTTAS